MVFSGVIKSFFGFEHGRQNIKVQDSRTKGNIKEGTRAAEF